MGPLEDPLDSVNSQGNDECDVGQEGSRFFADVEVRGLAPEGSGIARVSARHSGSPH
jgi:hypothetical protein